MPVVPDAAETDASWLALCPSSTMCRPPCADSLPPEGSLRLDLPRRLLKRLLRRSLLLEVKNFIVQGVWVERGNVRAREL